MTLKKRFLNPEILNISLSDYYALWCGNCKKIGAGSQKLSICIPTYKRPAQLEKLLRAICDLRRDSLDLIQIIVSINGDPKIYKNLIFKYINSPTISFHLNLGGSDFASNLAQLVKICPTEYCMYMGDDDWISPLFLQQIHDYLSLNDSIDALATTNLSTLSDSKIHPPIFGRFVDHIGLFSSNNLYNIYNLAMSVHSLFEPICARVFNVQKLKKCTLNTLSYKQIFPQHNHLLSLDYEKFYLVGADTKAIMINAFEESDKDYKGSGILTLLSGLPERVLHRILMLTGWSSIYLDSEFDLIDLILQLSSINLLLQSEFFRDCDSVINHIEVDFSEAKLLLAELKIFPLVQIDNQFYFKLFSGSTSYASKFLFFALGLNALMIRIMVDDGFVETNKSFRQLILSQSIKNTIHPLVKNCSLFS